MNELELLLNRKPDSVYLHDATVEKMLIENATITLEISLGGYHFSTNNDIFNDVWADPHRTDYIIKIVFYEVSSLEIDSFEGFEHERNEILDFKCLNGNKMKVLLDDCGLQSEILFNFQSFRWFDLGEEPCNKRQL